MFARSRLEQSLEPQQTTALLSCSYLLGLWAFGHTLLPLVLPLSLFSRELTR